MAMAKKFNRDNLSKPSLGIQLQNFGDSILLERQWLRTVGYQPVIS
jgi:hypothetical protein